MYFKNEKEFNNLISGNNVINLGKGSQGECYYDAKTGNKIRKYGQEVSTGFLSSHTQAGL